MKNFNDIYEAIYRKCQNPLEEMRKKTKNGIIVVSIVSILIGILLSIVTGYYEFMMITIIAITLYVVLSGNRKEYVKYFKENVVKTFVKEYSENLDYDPLKGIDRMEYDKGQFERYDRYHSEDLIYGTLQDEYKICMSEVHTEDESTDSDGDTTYTTLFHGLFASVEFDKVVPTNMRLRKNSISLFGNKDKIEMDSGEFEKKYNVYSTDKIIAMQLLTADIMQMLLDFKEKNKLLPEITLTENHLYIRFATGSIFEANILKKSLDYDTLKKYYDTISFTLDITEKFLKNIKDTEM